MKLRENVQADVLVVIGNDAHHHRHFPSASASMMSAICIAAAGSIRSSHLKSVRTRNPGVISFIIVRTCCATAATSSFVTFPAALITNSRFD